jgi:O-antigen/teichoic acid export membrane protein
MKQAVRIRWNSFFSLLSSGIRLLTNVLLFLGIARFYGPETFGQFATAHTFSTLFLILADFGLDLLFTTEVARQRTNADHLFRSFASVKLLFACTAMLGMWLMPLAHNFSDTTRWLIYIFSTSVAFNGLMNFFFALFRGFEQLHHETWVSFVGNAVLLVFMVLLGILRAPIWLFAVLFTGTRALGLILAAITATRLVRLQAPKINLTEWKEVMGQGWIFGVYLVFGTLFFQLDTLLLALWKGDYAVGVYQSVMKLVALTLTLPEVANSALLPVFSRFYNENEQRWEQMGRLLNKTLWLLGLPIALIFFVYADQVIQLLYGSEEFAPAVPIMRVAALIIVLRFVWESYGLMLTTSGRQFVKMVIVVVATVITVVLNLLAIPRYGIYGAALVSLVANLFVAAGFFFSSRSFFLQWTLDARYLLPGILTLILGAILWNLHALSLWYSIPAALALYAFIFYFVGYTKDERRVVFFGAGTTWYGINR